MKTAALRRIDRAWNFAAQYNSFTLPFDGRIGDRNSRKQRLRVWMKRSLIEVVAISDFNNLSKIHHGDTVAYMPNDAEIVSDKKIGQAQLFLQFFQ